MENELIDRHKEFVREYYINSNIIPDFINTRKFTHKKCYEIFSEVLTIMKDLLHNNIIKQKKVEDIYKDVIELLSEIMEIEPELGNNYYNFIIKITNYYIEESTKLELYEISHNLKRFNDLLELNTEE